MLTTVLLSVGIGAVLLMLLYKPKNSKTGWEPLRQRTKDEIPDYTGVKRVIEPNEVQEIRLAKKGIGAAKPTTVCEMLQKASQVAGNKLALQHDVAKGVELKWTWAEVHKQSQAVAKSLMALGLKKCEITNIIGFNSPEWFFAEYGTQLCGGIPAGVYTTSNPGAMAYIANHAKAKIIIAESKKYLDRYCAVKDQLSLVSHVIVWTKMDDHEMVEYQRKLEPMKLLTWDQFIAAGAAVSDGELQKRTDDVQPGNIGALIYTSGTTGNPKAVMCCHDAMCFEARALITTIKNAGPAASVFFNKNFNMVSYLPLNHAAAKVTDMLGPMFYTAEYGQTGVHATVFIARPDALKGSLVETMKKAKPTLFFGVPRVWEKFQEKMAAAGKKTPFPLNKLSAYGKTLGRTWFKNRFIEGDGSVPALWPFFNNTLFALVRKKLGLDNCVFFATGAAPIKEETLMYFGSIGIPIMNAYGMSENMGACCLNILNNFAMGSAGAPLDGFDVKIDHVPSRDKPGNGEILIGGRGNMTGYMYESAKTAATLNEEGYVRSGDVGMLKNGCLFITGRIKELIIGAGGENIAPVPIEQYIATIRPAISNIVMIGNQRKYNVCLISLKSKVDPDTGIPGNELVGEATSVDPACKTIEEAQKSKKWEEYLTSGIKKYNNNPDVCVSRASKIQKFKILPKDLNIPDGTLGPTLKCKRSVVEKTYLHLIDSMYG